jgi:uncharacterized protein YdeI (YjbR/CyaY-like superfamily)
MKKSPKNPKVDAILSKRETWQKELQKLRAILLDCGLTEELKWGKPCYTFQAANLIMIYGLKESCAIAFFNGPLLKDKHKLLNAPGPNSQSNRWIKFTRLDEIEKREAVLKAYIRESVAAEKAGLKVTFKKEPEAIPEELKKKLAQNPALKKAFTALTPGRQRGYILYITAAKQPQTRDSRIDKWTPHILKGKGFHDR